MPILHCNFGQDTLFTRPRSTTTKITSFCIPSIFWTMCESSSCTKPATYSGICPGGIFWAVECHFFLNFDGWLWPLFAFQHSFQLVAVFNHVCGIEKMYVLDQSPQVFYPKTTCEYRSFEVFQDIFLFWSSCFYPGNCLKTFSNFSFLLVSCMETLGSPFSTLFSNCLQEQC